jgi:hypothetical protein
MSVLTVSSNTVMVGTAVTFTATVTDQNSAPVTSGQLIFCDATATYCEDAAELATAQLTSAGVAVVNLRLGVGSYSVKAVFIGTNSDAPSSSHSQALTVSGHVPTNTALAVTGPDNTFTLTATVTGGGRVTPTGSVVFTDTTWNTSLGTQALDPKTASLNFQQLAGYPVGSGDLGLTAVCDINGDGKPDLVVASNYGQVQVLLGNGDGTFQVLPAFFAGTNVSVAKLAVADFNGDGRLDLAVTSGVNSGGVNILLGNGDGTFQTSQYYATTYAVAGVAVGDLNGDGIPDIVTANGFYQTVSVLLGNGDGSFQAPQMYSAGTHPAGVTVGDFNGDGKADLAVADLYYGTISILLGNGDGTFQQAKTVPGGGGAVLFAADFNRDGKVDLVGVTGYAAYVFLGNGDGTFQPVQSYQVGQNTYDLAIGDMNADGIPDFVTVGVSNNSGVVGIFLGNGDGTFQSALTFPSGGSVLPVVAGDFNGDGSMDLAVGGATNLLLNVWSVQATASSVSLQGVGNHGVFASYDGDTAFAASHSTTVNLVHGTPTTLALNAAPSATVQAGKPVQLTATLSPNTYSATLATGTVTFYDGAAQIGTPQTLNSSGQAALPIAALTAGYHNFVAAYGGDTTFAPVKGSLVAAGVLGTMTTLAVSSNNVAAGTPVVFTATVTDQYSAPVTAGQVTFCDANATYCEDAAVLGTAQLTSAGTAAVTLRLGIGNHSIKAVYRGTNLDFGNNSNVQAVTVTGALPSAAALVAIGYGDYTLTATVTGAAKTAPTGTIVFTDATTGNATLATASLDGTTAVMFPANTFPISSGGGASALVVADFNGDGKPDLAVSNSYDHTVGVLLGNGDGTFQALQTIAGVNNAESVAVGDFNGDGKIDLVVANDYYLKSGSVSILLGNGDGTFQAPQTYAAGNNPYQIAVGDFNGDGRLDFAVTNYSDNTIGVYLGNGDGTFQPPQIYATGTYPLGVVTGDFNGDGVLDLAVTNNMDNTLGILLGNGDGTFQAQHAYSAGNQPFRMAVGDFNGDGKPDLVVTNTYSGYSLSVFLGNGDGTFQPQRTYDTKYATYAVAVGDFNGDGKLDLAVDDAFDNLAILSGNGDGTFQTKQSYPAGMGPGVIAVGDFNGDGKPDLVTSDFQPTLSVLLNLWSVQATALHVSVVGPPTHSVFAAYAGDSVYPASNSNAVNLINISGVTLTAATVGSGTVASGTEVSADGNINCGSACAYNYTFGTPVTLTATAASGWTFSNWTGCDIVNGNLCTVTMNYARTATATFIQYQSTYLLTMSDIGLGLVASSDSSINCGSICSSRYNGGTTVTLTATPSPGRRLASWSGCDSVNGVTCQIAMNTDRDVVALFTEAAQDFDGDLKTDVLWRNKSTGDVDMWFMNGATIVGAQFVLDVSDPNWQIIGTGDFNGDGKADVLWRNQANGAIVIWLMNGASLAGSGLVYTISDPNWQVAGISDFNGDGEADILWRNKSTGTTVLWLMNGTTIAASQGMYSPDTGWQIAGIADFNGDGMADILWRNTSSGAVVTWLMNGATIAGSGFLYSIPDPNWQVVGTGDFNGDGKADILWYNKVNGVAVMWFMNGLSIANSQYVYTNTDPNWQAAMVGDFNGDGKTDILWRNSSNGVIVLWLMNGATISGSQFVYQLADPNWQMY